MNIKTSSLWHVNINSYNWSDKSYSSEPLEAYYLFFSASDIHHMGAGNRWYAFPVHNPKTTSSPSARVTIPSANTAFYHSLYKLL